MYPVLTGNELPHPPRRLLLNFHLTNWLAVGASEDAHFVGRGFDVVALEFGAKVFTQALGFFDGGAGTDGEIVVFEWDLGFFGFDEFDPYWHFFIFDVILGCYTRE